MKNSMKKLLVCVLVMMIAAGQSGCAIVSDEGGTEGKNGRTELVLWTYYETEMQKKSMDELVAGFNKSQEEYHLTWEYHGPAVATSLIDLGTRFRLIINAVDCKKCEKSMPKLPVATAFWTPQPSLEVGAQAWLLAGGAHHTAFSYDLTVEQLEDWAAAMGIESVVIDNNTTIRDFKNVLRWNSVAYR